MTYEEIYCMGRAEYLNAFEGYSLTEGYEIAENELRELINQEKDKKEVELCI